MSKIFCKGNKKLRTVVSLLLSVCMLFSVCFTVKAEKLSDKYGFVNTETNILYEENPMYYEVSSKWQKANINNYQGSDKINLDISKFASFEGKAPTLSSKDGMEYIIWNKETQSITWKVNIETEALYNIGITYSFEEKGGMPAYRAVSVDGEFQYSESEKIPFYRTYVPNDEIKTDLNGDEIVSPNIEKLNFNTVLLSDSAGVYYQPLKWHLIAGEHSITIHFVDQSLNISGISINAPIDTPSYKEVSSTYNTNEYQLKKDDTILFQAENFLKTTHSTITKTSDGDPANTPYSIRNVKMNVLGGSNWSSGGQFVTYEFNVKKTGYYKLALRLKQNFNSDLSSYRQIKIDDVVPFDEFNDYEFEYNRGWYTETLSNSDNTPFLLYLTKGKHTLSFTVTHERTISEVFYLINLGSMALSELYKDILLITSSEPDTNYDYDLEESIKDLPLRMEQISDNLNNIINILSKAYGDNSALINNAKALLQTINELKDNPDSIPVRIDDFVNSITDFGDLSNNLSKQPLLIDEIGFYPQNCDVVNKESNFFERLWATIISFITSFSKDYNSVGGVSSTNDDAPEIDVWVARAKEWSQVVQELIQSDFVVNHNINVNLNMLPSGSASGTINPVLLSITSGEAPDVILGSAASTIVEYAIRDIVVDVSKLDGFDEFTKQFPERSFTALKYDDGVYGIPDTIDFNVLMYRKDVLSSLNLPVPNTWNEVFYQTLPALYQNNMQMAAPSYALLLYQNGGRYYTDDGIDVKLDSAISFASFEQYISLYKDLGFPITADFYNRFRTGEMPLGIVGFDIYMKVLTAAPELANKVGISLIPGVKKADGTIDRTHTTLIQNANMIMSSSDEIDASWEFLKWWMSYETQSNYSMRIEGNIGTSARINSANMEAFKSLPWNNEHLEVILESFETATDIPQVLGGTIVDRLISNATNSCLYDNVRPRVALETAVEGIREEFKRKQKLYNISQ